MKRTALSVKLYAAAASVLIIAAFSFPGCLQTFQKKIQEISNACRNAASQIESSISISSRTIMSMISNEKALPSSEISAAFSKGSANPESMTGDMQSVKKIPSVLPALSASTQNVAVPSAIAAGSKYSAVNGNPCYQSLRSEEARQIYRLIGGNVNQISVQKSSENYPIRTFTYDGNASEAQIRLALLAYTNDNPQVFWLADAYGFSKQNGITSIQLYSVLSPDECVEAQKCLDAAASSVISSLPGGLSEFDREEYLFNYIVSRCSYDTAAVQDQGRWQAFTAYGAIVDGSAVCEGYSRAMQLLAQYAGLNCIVVSGSSGGSGHMWNEIEISGSWYHLDLTWCDNSMLIYNYYNVTDAVIAQTHQISPLASGLSDGKIEGSAQFNFVLHECNSTAANYFQVRGIPVSSDSSVIDALEPVLEEKKTSAVFRIQGNFDATVQTMASGKLSHWIAQAAKAAGVRNVRATKYVTDSADSGVTVAISYD